MDMPLDATNRPNVIPWPPVLFILLFAAAYAAGAAFPTPPPTGMAAWFRLAGIAVAAAGIGLDLWSILTMHRHKTNVLPHRAADRLVTAGPFRFSRNPIYLGNTVLLAGFAIALANPFFLLAAALNVVLVTRLAITREEAHLAERFGDAWRTYASTVPRWIGPADRR